MLDFKVCFQALQAEKSKSSVMSAFQDVLFDRFTEIERKTFLEKVTI